MDKAQKDFPQNLSDIESDSHGDSVDLVSNFAFKPVPCADLTVVLTMSYDRFDSASAFLPPSFGGGNASLIK